MNRFDKNNRSINTLFVCYLQHHCRRCGRIYCNKCVNQKLPLPRLSFVDPVRMCSNCANTTIKENEFFDKHLRILTNGK